MSKVVDKLAEARARLSELNAENSALKKSVDKYYKNHHEAEPLRKFILAAEEREQRQSIEFKTKFINCEHPDIGVLGKKGSAVLDSEDDLKTLIMSLTTSWRSRYSYKWEGPGTYSIIPNVELDYEGDKIYLSHFLKKARKAKAK